MSFKPKLENKAVPAPKSTKSEKSAKGSGTGKKAASGGRKAC